MRLDLGAVAVVGTMVIGCSDDTIVPNYDETRALPGPCRAQTQGSEYRFEYYDGGRVTLVGADWGYPQLEGAEWTYDADGGVSSIRATKHDPLHTRFTDWSFDALHVTSVARDPVAHTQIYDRGLFAFLPLVGIRLGAPEAELGLIMYDAHAYTWTSDGNRRVRHSEGSARTVTVELDERGRTVSIVDDTAIDFPPSTFTFEYDGDHLLRERLGSFERTYHYDRGGNLVETKGGPGGEVYAYDCW